MIIETSSGQLFSVTETGKPGLDHVWTGVAVKKVKGQYIIKATARPQLVRKAATTVVDAEVPACTYPACKCIVSTSTSQPEPVCPKGLQQ